MATRSGIRSAHFFKKVPRDITEGTWLGGVVSIVGVLVTLALAGSLTQSYRTVRVKTELVLDKTSDSYVELTFNITMERLPCRFTSIDLFDETGTKRLNITQAIVRERISSVDGHVLSDEEAEVWTDEPDLVAGEDGFSEGRQLADAGGEGGSGETATEDLLPELSVVPSGAAASRPRYGVPAV